MRLTKERIQAIASGVVERLRRQHLLEVSGQPETLVRSLESAISEELGVEDRLNAEVREILKKFDREFQTGQADYQKMFTMVKQKLVRERGIVL